jgi:hypothetical protein
MLLLLRVPGERVAVCKGGKAAWRTGRQVIHGDVRRGLVKTPQQVIDSWAVMRHPCVTPSYKVIRAAPGGSTILRPTMGVQPQGSSAAPLQSLVWCTPEGVATPRKARGNTQGEACPPTGALGAPREGNMRVHFLSTANIENPTPLFTPVFSTHRVRIPRAPIFFILPTLCSIGISSPLPHIYEAKCGKNPVGGTGC